MPKKRSELVVQQGYIDGPLVINLNPRATVCARLAEAHLNIALPRT